MPPVQTGVSALVRGIRLHRLLKLIALLRGATSYNARRLAEHFQTSRRNVYRDLAVLELAGVPYTYDADFGEGGGYRIRADFWFPTVGLSDQECLDLAVLTRAAESRNIPLLEDVATVRDKLIGTLPAKQQDLIREASELFDVLSLHLADHGHSRKIMITVQLALLQRQQLEGIYRTPYQKKAVRVKLQPRRCFLAQQAWYLAAEDRSDCVTKLYRLARFNELKLLPKPITIERNFSLREYLGNAWAVHKGKDERDWHVEIEFTPEAAELVAETKWHHTQELEQRKDGSLAFRATVSGLQEIKWWILGWGDRAKVTKPQELVVEITRLLEKTLKQYQPAQEDPHRREKPRRKTK